MVSNLNKRAAFITNAGSGHGSSLYCVTAHWVIRCSGNNTGDRVSTTFLRKRSIEYKKGGLSDTASLGAEPIEGTHTGHPISEILDIDNLPQNAPQTWVSTNGVSWDTAVNEIHAAMEFARNTGYQRASREVGRVDFEQD